MPWGGSSIRHAVALLASVAALVSARRAGAFCREVTKAAPDGWDPVTSGCFINDPEGGAPLPTVFWRNQCVGFSLNQGGSVQFPLAEAQAVASQAFLSWMAAGCSGGSPSISITQFPAVECAQVPSQEHNNVIIFEDGEWDIPDSANAIGYTTLTVNLDTGEILGADIQINTADFTIVTSEPPPPNAYDLATILTHEAGHFLGLAHTQDTTGVMYAYYKADSTVLQPDDLSGICEIYPPGGTRNTQLGSILAAECNDQPPLGFETACGSMDASVSSAPGNDAGDNEDGPTFNDTLFGCGIGSGVGDGGSRGAGWGLGAAALAWIVVRRRSRRIRPPVLRRTYASARRARFSRANRLPAPTTAPAGGRAGASIVLMALLATCAASVAGERSARATISVSVLLDELLERATAVAVVTPLEQRSVWENGRIATYTHARVERVLAGRLDGDLWIRAPGGRVGHIGQLVEGQASFVGATRSLVFLHPHVDPVTHSPTGSFGVVEGAQGQYPMTMDHPPRLAVARDLGGLLPPVGATRPLARDELGGHTLDEVASEIADLWPRFHP